jgi:hypothetical protein
MNTRTIRCPGSIDCSSPCCRSTARCTAPRPNRSLSSRFDDPFDPADLGLFHASLRLRLPLSTSPVSGRFRRIPGGGRYHRLLLLLRASCCYQIYARANRTRACPGSHAPWFPRALAALVAVSPAAPSRAQVTAADTMCRALLRARCGFVDLMSAPWVCSCGLVGPVGQCGGEALDQAVEAPVDVGGVDECGFQGHPAVQGGAQPAGRVDGVVAS